MNSLARSNVFEEENKEPFELVIEKNLRSKAKRVQDETREQLARVLTRVENVCIYTLIDSCNNNKTSNPFDHSYSLMMIR